MKIVALVKYVPDATGDREFSDDGTVDREVAGLLSELDEYAVEQALQIAENADDAEVIAVTVGPDDASDALKKALQMGAGSAVHINDDDIHGTDALGTSKILAAAVQKIEPDLVICGMASTDGSMGVVPAMLAERLGWPAVTYGVDLKVEGSEVSIRRDGDTASQTISAQLPAVVSVTDQSGEARYPSMKGIMAAKKKKVEDWELDDLDLDGDDFGLEAAYSKVESTSPRPPKAAGTKVVDEDGSGGKALADFLVNGKFI
ncbi:electron transfer flavoprotein subunit beta/FixA family protein [Granulicoccus phenolivorans]|uniref:electron transfer flavoprotein subunit beta/FixA family protein n=1 Tax=Granulicoccus phenolivorans TaxID=266854 RepID=UPI0004017438|nr:electron transfer flavoprotein subunit beta/FixA family protein [Granulicoccus phenolivorans]